MAGAPIIGDGATPTASPTESCGCSPASPAGMKASIDADLKGGGSSGTELDNQPYRVEDS